MSSQERDESPKRSSAQQAFLRFQDRFKHPESDDIWIVEEYDSTYQGRPIDGYFKSKKAANQFKKQLQLNSPGDKFFVTCLKYIEDPKSAMETI